MRTFVKTLCCIIAFSLALVFAAPVRAGDAPKPALTQVGFVAGKSVDALAAFAKLSGMDLPPAFGADGIEQVFPFIGKDALATDRPIGIAMVGGPDIEDPMQGLVYVFPVKPAAATLESFKIKGATAMAGHPDTVLMGGLGIRRTADYIVYSQNPAAVSLVNVSAIADAVKSGDALVRVFIDVKAARENMPRQRKQLQDMLTATAGGDKTKEQSIGSTLKSLDELNRFEVSLDNGEKGLRLAFTAAPSKLPQITVAKLPGMPPGVLARMDLGVSFAEAITNVDMEMRSNALVKSIQDDPTGNSGKPYTDAQKQEIAALIRPAFALFTDSSATSVGIEMSGADPVFYIVQHWSKKMDVPGEIQRLAARFNALTRQVAPTITMEVQTYQIDGVSVLRVVDMENGKPQGYADIVQKGDDVYATLCTNNHLYINKLLAAGDEVPITKVYSAWLDLEKLTIALMSPDGWMSGVAAEPRAFLIELLKGQKIRIASSIDGDAATVEMTMDKTLIQNVPKVVAAFGVGSAKEPPQPAKP